MDLTAYLNRIGFRGEPGISLATLRELHARHAFSIPFENLDVHLKSEIDLDPDALFEKLILSQRGGYCYELNGLFSFLLKELGFTVRYLVARSMLGYQETRPRTHMLLLIKLEDANYLADLGFTGMSLLEPIELEAGHEFEQYGQGFRLIQGPEDGFTLQLKRLGSWVPLYSFDLHEQLYLDFELANFFNSHSPRSIFTNQVICALYNPKGRTRLIGRSLRTEANGTRRELIIESEAQYAEVLAEQFGLRPSAEEIKRLFLVTGT